MTNLARPVMGGFNHSHFIVGLHLSDLKENDALRRARGDAGSSITWIIGHLLNYRCAILNALGVETPNPWRDTFEYNTPATEGAGYPDIAILKKEWNAIHEQLCQAVESLTEEQLLAETKLPSQDGTLLGGLMFFILHEAYHGGVVGLLRVEMGYRHTHELAMEAMQGRE